MVLVVARELRDGFRDGRDRFARACRARGRLGEVVRFPLFLRSKLGVRIEMNVWRPGGDECHQAEERDESAFEGRVSHERVS